jgi:hypothetical protein
MDETRLQALEIVMGFCIALLRDMRPEQFALAAGQLERTLKGNAPMNVVPGVDERASVFALERALAIVQGQYQPTGRA